MEDNHPKEEKTPVLSICCTVYNHANFLEETLNGFLMQKVNFPIEILINDDCSTDDSKQIIQKYVKENPGVFTPFYQKENQYSKGVRPMTQLLLPKARGKYIALCEGDDYWSDPNKLQQQVDFLENNSEFSMCCTNYSEVDVHGKLLKEFGWGNKYRAPVISHLTILEDYKPKLLTSVIRKSAIPSIIPATKKEAPNGDNFLFAQVTEKGPAAYLDFISGCYRLNEGGVWGMSTLIRQKEMQLRTFKTMKRFFVKDEEIKAINARISRIQLIMSGYYLKKMDLLQAVKLFIEALRISRKPIFHLFKVLMNKKK
ncbi:glycosyltransferase [uncultured Draconibacterium sp.]|uniref:glycosyltransferase n=1 Tax=uncultured Draconibacterium sp. TaxID=1573823 RepID=UPI0029C6AD8E|nr:glycosyltransferase [uncultured Draconibacterium sp.]